MKHRYIRGNNCNLARYMYLRLPNLSIEQQQESKEQQLLGFRHNCLTNWTLQKAQTDLLV